LRSAERWVPSTTAWRPGAALSAETNGAAASKAAPIVTQNDADFT
jgi:hypothetical protein